MENYLRKEEWEKIMNHLQDLTSGKRRWEHPGAPHYHPGAPYEPNEDERIFMERTSKKMQTAAFTNFLLWGMTPYLLFRVPHIRNRFFQNVHNPGVICFGFGVCGYLTATHRGADAIAEERVRLENSPLARETRYQLWKYNCQHPWLIGFEKEFEENARVEVRSNVIGEDVVQRYNEELQESDGSAVDSWFKSDRIPDIPAKQETLQDLRSYDFQQKQLHLQKRNSQSFQTDFESKERYADDFDDAFVSVKDFGIPDDEFLTGDTEEWKS